MKPSLCLLAAALLASPLAQAQTTTISTTQNSTSPLFGNDFEDAIGESLTIPTGVNTLNSFTFTSVSSFGPNLTYTPEIFTFNGSTAVTGAALFTGTQSTLANTTSAIVIDPHLTVTAGQQIMIVLVPTVTGPGSIGNMGATFPITYTGGQLYVAFTGGSTDPTTYNFSFSDQNAAFTAIFGNVADIASMSGLNSSQRGIASSIDAAVAANSVAGGRVAAALMALPASSVPGALDQLSPAKFSNFASTTAVNNAVFETQYMDSYLAGLRDSSTGGFALGNGKLDSSGFVVNDPNVDPGLQMIHSRMLAWEDPVSTMTDVPGAVLGGVDMKDVKQIKTQEQECSPWDVFLRGNVILAQGFSQDGVAHFDDNSESVVLGADYHFTPHLLAGVTASYSHTDATLDTFNSSATVDSYSPGVYASWADGGGYVNFVGRYSYNSYTENRDIAFLGQSANGATDGNEGVVDLDGGYDFHTGPWTYGPVAGVQYTHLTVNSYSESGSDADLAVNEDQSDSLRSRLGGEVRYLFNAGGMKFTPHVEATWQHEFLTQDRGLTSQFSDFGGGSFTVRTPDQSDESALLDLGLDANVNKTITVFSDYLMQAGASNYFGQSIQAGVRVNF